MTICPRSGSLSTSSECTHLSACYGTFTLRECTTIEIETETETESHPIDVNVQIRSHVAIRACALQSKYVLS